MNSKLRFFLTYKGIETEIDEVVKFDGFKPKLKRTASHGMDAEYSDTELMFTDTGREILKKAYDADGVDAEVEFKVTAQCSGRPETEYYRGQIDFNVQYEEHYGNVCSVVTRVSQTGVNVMFRNRRDAKVDMDSLQGFDGAALRPYESMGKEISLPSKTIKLQSRVQLKKDTDPYVVEKSVTYFTVPFVDVDEIAELGNIEYRFNTLPDPILTVSKGKLSIDKLLLTIKIDAELDGNGLFVMYNLWYKYGNWDNSATSLVDGFDLIYYDNINSPFEIMNPKEGDKIWLYITAGTSSNDSFLIKNKACSFMSITSDTAYAPTSAKTYPVHECLARIAEAATDDKATVKSDFYGRTDSGIMPTATDGCGALRVLTNGYSLRRAAANGESSPCSGANVDPGISGKFNFYLNWNTLFRSLEAIDNVGWAFEGENIRIEPVRYFYKNNVIFTCTDIGGAVKAKLNNESYCQLFKIGYKKWLSGEYNSLDSFHATREYRTGLKMTQSTKERYSDIIADGYAIEATRRKQIESSANWQYDNDTFIIDMRRSGNELEVNTGATAAEGLIDPDTVYNARLSPARMAMRHYADAMQGTKQPVMIYGAAEGYAGAKMKSTGNCITENRAIAENGNITAAMFTDPEQSKVYADVMLLNFKYPLTEFEFAEIKRNPYGLIDADGITGWIKELDFDTRNGLAEFTLILKK